MLIGAVGQLAAGRGPCGRPSVGRDRAAGPGGCCAGRGVGAGRGSDLGLYRVGCSYAGCRGCGDPAVAHPRSGPLAAALVRPLRWLGMISYGLYLWHWPVFIVLDEQRLGLDRWPLFGVRLVVSLALALLSYYALELPIRERRRPRWLTLLPFLSGFTTSGVANSDRNARSGRLGWAVAVPALAASLVVARCCSPPAAPPPRSPWPTRSPRAGLARRGATARGNPVAGAAPASCSPVTRCRTSWPSSSWPARATTERSPPRGPSRLSVHAGPRPAGRRRDRGGHPLAYVRHALDRGRGPRSVPTSSSHGRRSGAASARSTASGRLRATLGSTATSAASSPPRSTP
jgi:hypothetical protein